MPGFVSRPLVAILVSLLMLAGCGQGGVDPPVELAAFIGELKENGVEGSLYIRAPFSDDMEYVAEYTIARFASTRIISVFKFKDAGMAEAGLREALKNTKLSGQARNAEFVIAATFQPPDDEAVEKIKALFLAHTFE